MPKISKTCDTSYCYAHYVKTSKQKILKTTMKNLYIYIIGRDNPKQAKSFIFIVVVPQQKLNIVEI